MLPGWPAIAVDREMEDAVSPAGSKKSTPVLPAGSYPAEWSVFTWVTSWAATPSSIVW
jgi:hypothetical protein